MKSVWVTGAYGFLGRNLCRHLATTGFHVAGIGHGRWTAQDAAEWGIRTWISSDIHRSALAGLEAKTAKPYAVFHAAGGGSVPASVHDPSLDFQRTVSTTVEVLEYIRSRSPRTKLIYPSSAAVYGAGCRGKIHEETPMNPVSPYGTHKKIAETLCSSHAAQFGTMISILRLFSLYGNGLKKQLLWDICCKLETGKGEVSLYGTGEEIRDWLHIDDTVELLLLALEKASADSLPVNGGTGIGTTVREVAEEIRHMFETERRIVFQGIARDGDPRFYLADTARAESWGFRHKKDIIQGIREYVNWFRSHRGME